MTRFFQRLAAARVRQSLAMMSPRVLTTDEGLRIARNAGYDCSATRRYAVRTR